MSLKHYITKLFVSYLYIFNITNFGAVFVFAALKEEKKNEKKYSFSRYFSTKKITSSSGFGILNKIQLKQTQLQY